MCPFVWVKLTMVRGDMYQASDSVICIEFFVFGDLANFQLNWR